MDPKTSMEDTTLRPQGSSMQVKPNVLKHFPKEENRNMKKTISLVLISVVVVIAGAVTGYFLSGTSAKESSNQTSMTKDGVVPGSEKSDTEAGIADESVFSDEAEGTLVEGGINGEGTHYLDRDLGPDKYVYLTSTVIDLQSFVGKNVHVWGQTMSAEQAGWLMDVGKLKVVE